MKDDRDPQTYAIIGAAIEVHGELGAGFLERVYSEALTREFDSRGIPFAREVTVPVLYKGARLDCGYRADFICYDEVIVELKAMEELVEAHVGQVINYLKATGYRRALLLNFGAKSLEVKRISN